LSKDELVECGEQSYDDINLSTIGYFRVNLNACEEDLNFELNAKKYIRYALKNTLWDLKVDEDSRLLVVLRGRKDDVRTHIVRDRINFDGFVIAVSDIIDDNAVYLEAILLFSHAKYNDEIIGTEYHEKKQGVRRDHDNTYDMDKRNIVESNAKFENSIVTNSSENSKTKPYNKNYANIVLSSYNNPIVRRLATKIADECDENWRQVKALYEWVRDNIRYVGDDRENYIQDPEETIETKSGTHGDQAVLLASLLKSMGFRVNLIFTPDRVYVATYLPDAPDTCKTYADKPKEDGTNWREWIGLDPTCKNCEFGVLPQECYNILYVEEL
jgi:hypothetical protein